MEGVEWHLTCNEIEAWVSVKKKALPQYSEGRDELNNEVTCWIPSEADNAFCINFKKVVVDQDDVSIKLFVDGCRIAGSWTLAGPSKYDKRAVSCVEAPGDVYRCLVFDSIELTDNDNYLENSTQDVGEIKVVVHKIKVLSCEMKLPYRGSSETLTSGRKWAWLTRSSMEKSRHENKVSATRTASGKWDRTPVDQAKVKVPESPPQMDIKVELSDDEDDELRAEAILEKERALIAELEQVRLAKRALARSKDKRPKQKFKRETAHFVPGEIIDLTI